MNVTKNDKTGRFTAYETLEDGKRIYGYSSKSGAIAKENCRAAIKKYESVRDAKIDLVEGNIPLHKALSSYVDLYKQDAKESTIETDRGTIRAIECDPLGKMKVKDITSDDVQAFMNRQKKLSISSGKKRFLMIRAYFNHFYNRDPGNNPMRLVKTPKRRVGSKTKKLNILNDVEMVKLREELLKQKYQNGKAMIVCMYEFLRISELIGLHKSDIDLERETISINRQMQCVGSRWIESLPKYESVREVPIAPPVMDIIREAYENCKSDDDYLFIGTTGNHLLNNSCRKCLNAGLTNLGLKHIRIHDLRHTGISALLRNGIAAEAVQQWAGHKSLKETLDTYYEVLPQQLDDGAAKMKAMYNAKTSGAVA